jgi:REP element-mobilizing transposase RayT
MSSRDGIVMPEPLAYFLTWPTYGTWLPGDERGWVKLHHGHQLPDLPREMEAAARMAQGACRLSEQERSLVEQTVKEHCVIRGWMLHAINCRSNHLHLVVTADRHPDVVRDQLKAWTSRKLKELQRKSTLDLSVRTKWWAERGSRRYINDETSLEAAIQYVRDGQ